MSTTPMPQPQPQQPDRAAAARMLESDEFRALPAEQQQAVIARMREQFAGAPQGQPVPGSDPTKQPPSFYARHPYLSEAVLGALGGLGIPETQNPIIDFFAGLGHAINPTPQNTQEKVSQALGLPAPVERMVEGMGRQVYGYGKQVLTGTPEEKVHGAAGATTLLGSLLLGSKKAPEVVADTSAAIDASRVARGTQDIRQAASAGADVNFTPNLQRAIGKGYLRDVAATKPATMREAAQAVLDRADRIQKEVVQPAIDRHAADTLSGDTLAVAIQNTMTPELEHYYPELRKQIQKDIDRFSGKQVTIEDASQLLQRYNAINKSLSEAAPETAAAAQRANIGKAASKAAADNLREQIYSRLEKLGDPGIAEAQRDYGALREVGEILRDNVVRAEREGKGPGFIESAMRRHPYVTLGSLLGSTLNPAALAIPVLQYLVERRGAPNAQIARGIARVGKVKP